MCWKCILLNTQLYIRDFRRLSYPPYHSSSHRTALFTRERALPIESRLLKPTPTSACTIPPSKSYINDAELQCSIRMKCLWWMRRRSVNICSEQDEMNKESHHHWQLSDATKFAPTKSYTPLFWGFALVLLMGLVSGVFIWFKSCGTCCLWVVSSRGRVGFVCFHSWAKLYRIVETVNMTTEANYNYLSG